MCQALIAQSIFFDYERTIAMTRQCFALAFCLSSKIYFLSQGCQQNRRWGHRAMATASHTRRRKAQIGHSQPQLL